MVNEMTLLKEGLTTCLVSPDDRMKKEHVEKLIEQGLMRSVPSFSLADFFTYETTQTGREKLNSQEKV